MARKSKLPLKPQPKPVSEEVVEEAKVSSPSPADAAPERKPAQVKEHTAQINGETLTFGFITH